MATLLHDLKYALRTSGLFLDSPKVMLLPISEDRGAFTMTPDAVKVDPKHYKVEFENDRVRVLRIRFGPHEKSVMHRHPAGIVVVLSDCDFRFNLPRGQKRDILGKAGQIVCRKISAINSLREFSSS